MSGENLDFGAGILIGIIYDGCKADNQYLICLNEHNALPSGQLKNRSYTRAPGIRKDSTEGSSRGLIILFFNVVKEERCCCRCRVVRNMLLWILWTPTDVVAFVVCLKGDKRSRLRQSVIIVANYEISLFNMNLFV